jgi:hypothetical protein
VKSSFFGVRIAIQIKQTNGDSARVLKLKTTGDRSADRNRQVRKVTTKIAARLPVKFWSVALSDFCLPLQRLFVQQSAAVLGSSPIDYLAIVCANFGLLVALRS